MVKINQNDGVAVEMSPVVPGSNVGLIDLRNSLLNTLDAATEMVALSTAEYAEGLNATFAFDWFDIKHADLGKTPEGKTLRTEKTGLFDGLKARGHSNPSVFWARLCDKARDSRYPEQAQARRDAEEAEAAAEAAGEGTGKGASRNRSPLIRNSDEIAALVKFNEGLDLEGEHAKLKPVQALLQQALAVIFHQSVN
jgi:hypothetical protein